MMKLIIFFVVGLVVLDIGLVTPQIGPVGPAQFGPGLICPDNTISYRPCDPNNAFSCQPNVIFFCYNPIGGSRSACCRRRPCSCPRVPLILCLFPRRRCFYYSDCFFGEVCCDASCGRRCALRIPF